jgi:hypothetical protein
MKPTPIVVDGLVTRTNLGRVISQVTPELGSQALLADLKRAGYKSTEIWIARWVDPIKVRKA